MGLVELSGCIAVKLYCEEKNVLQYGWKLCVMTTFKFLHVMFRNSWSRNDRKVMDNSTLFDEIRDLKWPPSLPILSVAGHAVNSFYYLADLIHLKYAFLL